MLSLPALKASGVDFRKNERQKTHVNSNLCLSRLFQQSACKQKQRTNMPVAIV